MKDVFEKTVTALYVNEDQSALYVCTYNTIFEYTLWADCCSETWFADIVGVEALIGQRVTGIDVLELPNPEDDRSRQEYDEAYGYRLRTCKGTCDVVFRNSSNGYYCGHMNVGIEVAKLPEGLEEIRQDWRA